MKHNDILYIRYNQSFQVKASTNLVDFHRILALESAEPRYLCSKNKSDKNGFKLIFSEKQGNLLYRGYD